MKRKILFSLPIVAIMVSLILKGCGGGDFICGGCKQSACVCEEPEDFDYDTLKKARFSMVVVDNSESMKGYFKEGQCRDFVEVVSNLVNYADSGNFMFFGEKNISGSDVTAKILETNSFSNTSDLVQMINTVSKGLGNDSIMFFITDGIPSVKYTTTALPEIQHIIKKNMNPSLGYSIYRMESKFDGTYYSEVLEKERKQPKSGYRTIEKRPYFIFVMGNPSLVRDFKNNNELKFTHQVHFNIHGDHKGIHIRPEDKTQFSGPDSTGVYFRKVNDDLKFTVKLPKCLSNDKDVEFIKNNAKLTLNDKPLEKIVIKNDKEGNITFSIDFASIESNQSPKNKIRILVENNVDSICSFSTEDDSLTINPGSDTDDKTYGIQYIIKGLYEGSTDKNMLDLTFSFE